MIEWWGSLGFYEQLFFGAGILATFVVFVQMVLMVFGSEIGGDMELDAGGEHSAGLEFLSIHTIAAFFMGFGWIGGGVLAGTSSLLLAVPAGLVTGVIFGAVIFYILGSLRRFDERFNVDPRNAIGQTAKVYIPIPANRTGEGQIELKFQGRYQVVAAVTSSGDPLPAQTPVLVVDLADDNVFVVRPLEQPLLEPNNQPQLQP